MADLVEKKSRRTNDKSDVINAQNLIKMRQKDPFAKICHYFSTGRYFCDYKLITSEKEKLDEFVRVCSIALYRQMMICETLEKDQILMLFNQLSLTSQSDSITDKFSDVYLSLFESIETKHQTHVVKQVTSL